MLRVGLAGVPRAWGWTTCSGSWRGAGAARAGDPAAGEGEELHPDLAGRRPVAPRHLRPQAEGAGRRPRRVQADRHGGPGPGDQRGLARTWPRSWTGSTLIRSMTSPESDHDRAAHHLLTGYRPSPAHRSIPATAASWPRPARRSAGMLPPYVAVPDAPIVGVERLPDARPTTRSPSRATRTSRASASRT